MVDRDINYEMDLLTDEIKGFFKANNTPEANVLRHELKMNMEWGIISKQKFNNLMAQIDEQKLRWHQSVSEEIIKATNINQEKA